MVTYHGGKQRIGKTIAEVIHDVSCDIEDEYKFTIRGYCEPFCGMLGVYKHIPRLFENHKPKLKTTALRLGVSPPNDEGTEESLVARGRDPAKYKAGDTNESVIKMWKALQKGWTPPKEKITPSEFLSLAKDGKSSANKGYLGHLYGFRGKYFVPFNDHISQSRKKNTAKRVRQIARNLDMVDFSAGPYTQFSNLKGYVIYCDPPYEIQSQYYDEQHQKRYFDSRAFWEWCRKMAKHNIVFVSEYKAPKDFDKLWSKGNEKLFLIYNK